MSNKNAIEKKSPKERDTLDLVELVCQLHTRTFTYHRSKEIHDSYVEAREELDRRVKGFDDLLDHLRERRDNLRKQIEQDSNNPFASDLRFSKGRLRELNHVIAWIKSEEE